MSAFRHAATLNTVGVIVLLVGIVSAVLVCRLGQNRSATSTTNSDWKDSSLSLTDSKVSTRDIELYGGKVEVLMVKWLEWLRRPESLAIIIATITALMTLGCFLVARPHGQKTRPYRIPSGSIATRKPLCLGNGCWPTSPAV